MKKFIAFRILAITLIAAILITSCSKDDGTDASVSENAKVSSYLKSFYSKDFQLGKSIESKVIKPTSTASSIASKSVEYEDLVLTEVFVANEERARGYILTNKTTNVFLYFVDVDRTDYKMTKVDIQANETQVLENIEQLDKYIATNQFDLIKVTQDLKDGIMINDEDIALSFSTSSSAKIVRQLVHVWANGC